MCGRCPIALCPLPSALCPSSPIQCDSVQSSPQARPTGLGLGERQKIGVNRHLSSRSRLAALVQVCPGWTGWPQAWLAPGGPTPRTLRGFSQAFTASRGALAGCHRLTHPEAHPCEVGASGRHSAVAVEELERGWGPQLPLARAGKIRSQKRLSSRSAANFFPPPKYLPPPVDADLFRSTLPLLLSFSSISPSPLTSFFSRESLCTAVIMSEQPQKVLGMPVSLESDPPPQRREMPRPR